MKTNEIIIVGGGSAGWMTASILIKSFPHKKITLIESPEVPKIGVGESTYEGINFYLEYLEIDRKDFFIHADASIKLAIQFRNFYKESGEKDFIYPFGRPNTVGSTWGLQDWAVKKCLKKDTPVQEYAQFYFPAASLVKYNSMSDDHINLQGFDPILYTALHFDAIKFSEWLKNNYAMPRGVGNIVSTVKNIVCNEQGIDYMILSNDQIVKADLYIDCTGFQSLLIGDALNETFNSYSEILPNNNAWATQIPYKDRSIELENVTRCTALKNGWCWNIPLWSRLGAGYVYSDKYTTSEDALKEFKNYLKNDLSIKRTEKEISELEFRNIKMRVGIYENVWSKNVVAIGLSAGFIEPLESNGLFSVHEFLFELVRAMSRDDITQWDKDVFNKAVRDKFDNFVEFIKLHYALSTREDSQYWKEISNQKYDFSLMQKNNISSHLYDVQKIKTSLSLEAPEMGGITWICAGMNYFLLDEVSLRLGEIMSKRNYGEEFEKSIEFLEQRKNKWDSLAKNSLSTEEYLENKYYKN